MNGIWRATRAWTVKRAPEILTTMAVTGTIGTGIAAAKAGMDSAKDIREEEDRKKRLLTFREKAALTWTNYIYAFGIGGIAIGSEIMAAVLQNRRLDAATALLAGTREYVDMLQKAVKEKVGEKRYTDIRDDVCRRKIEENPVTETVALPTGNGDHLMYESISGRYFTSDIETIRAAANDFMNDIINGMAMYDSLNCWYGAIGLPTIRLGEDIGWNVDNPLKVRFSTMIAADGRPCIILDYLTMPTDRYSQVY